MNTLIKYWPVIGFFGGLAANAMMVWIAWSLRQFAKNEVGRSMASLADRLEAADSGLATRLEAADEKTDAKVDELETRMTKVEGSITGVRRDIGNLPTKADIARVEGEIKAVGAQATATNEGIRRLEGYWLEKGVERG